MLEDLRRHAIAALARPHEATVATYGPAGLQADRVPCAAQGLRLYLLLPGTSDQLFNLEANAELVITTVIWRAHGRGRSLTAADRPAISTLSDHPSAPWCVWLEVVLTRLSIANERGWGAAETIDIGE